MIAPSLIVPPLVLMAAKASVVLAVAFGASVLMRRTSAAARHLVWLAAFVGVIALPVAGLVVPSLRMSMGPLNELVRSNEPRTVEYVYAPAAAIAAGVKRGIAEGKAPRAERIPVPLSVWSRRMDTLIAATSSDVMRAQLLTARAEMIDARKNRAGAVVYETIAPVAPATVPVSFLVSSTAAPVWPARVFLLWVFGFVMVAVAFAVGVLRTHIVACQAVPASGRLADEAEVLAAELGITRDVRVMTLDGPTMPMTWGAVRPVVLLPESARLWPTDRLREVLTHELAHVRRGDWLARLLAGLVCALHWFNPLAWMAAHRMQEEQELSCDDIVLSSGVTPSDYAAHLLEVARGLKVPAFAMANASVAMARPSQLTGRLLAVLDASRQRGVPSFTAGAVAWLLALAIVVPVAAATPAGHDVGYAVAEAPEVVDVVEPHSAVAAPVAPVAAEIPVAAALPKLAALAQDRCPEGRSAASNHTSSNSSSSSDDGRPRLTTLSIRQGDCILEVRIVGNVRFADDASDVTDVPRDASVRVTEDSDGIERRFEVSWRNGQLQRRWQVDGNTVEESAELRAWLAQTLQATFTRTGYDAVPRAMRAYRAGGLDSALAIANLTSSDYSRRQILMALMDSVRLPASEAVRIARQAESMSSDYEKAELLIAVTRKLRLDNGVQEAMISAAGTMSSDYEKGRVLAIALTQEGLSPAATQSLLRSAGQMSSDYEKAELLIKFLRVRPLEDNRRALFFDATKSMSSDYERRRVLSTVVAQQSVTPAIAMDVVTAGDALSSDYEHAELLVQVSQKFRTNSDIRTAVQRAADRMSSDYERNRVFASLGRASL